MTEDYYNNLAPYYKLIYPNWDASVQRQAGALDSVIQEYVDRTANTSLDVACGIGTQSIGLAKLSYHVTASDLSPTEVEQARKEALRQNVEIGFQVVDMRQVWETYQRQFDVVIACDNSIPHLLTNEEILLAFRQFFQCAKSGDCCIITVRDYAQLEVNGKGKEMYPRLVHQTDGGHVVMFDVLDFDGDYYEITTYIVDDAGKSDAQTQVIRGGKYCCIEIPTLEKLFREAGFREVNTLRDRYFQPLLIATK